MAKIPLNKFRSSYYNLTTVEEDIYTAKEQRAAVIINMMVSNNTNQDITVNLNVIDQKSGNVRVILTDFPIPAYDARSLVTGRMVLEGDDGGTPDIPPKQEVIRMWASQLGCTLSLGILETVNKN